MILVQRYDTGFLVVQNFSKTMFYDNSSGSSVNNEEPALYDDSDGSRRKVKQWIVSGDNQDDVEVGSLTNCPTPEEEEVERVLGIGWNPRKGSFKFSVRISLSSLRKKPRLRPDLTIKELLWDSSLPRSVIEKIILFFTFFSVEVCGLRK